jgi:hypothetical protein
MRKGIIIMLAWPKTPAIQTGAWYEGLMKLLGFNKNGYYMAGHSAIVLVDPENGELNYFDFGRYHAPLGHGRVRDKITDPDLDIKATARFNSKGQIVNLEEILLLFDANKEAFHGKNTMYASVYYDADVQKALDFAIKLRNNSPIPYGPFKQGGTNCSRFTSSVFRAGSSNFWKRLRLLAPTSLTPTTLGNVLVVSGDGYFYEIENNSVKKQKISFSKQLKNWVLPVISFSPILKPAKKKQEVESTSLIKA